MNDLIKQMKEALSKAADETAGYLKNGKFTTAISAIETCKILHAQIRILEIVNDEVQRHNEL